MNKCDFRKIEFVPNMSINEESFVLRFVQIKEIMDSRKRKTGSKPDSAEEIPK